GCAACQGPRGAAQGSHARWIPPRGEGPVNRPPGPEPNRGAATLLEVRPLWRHGEVRIARNGTRDHVQKRSAVTDRASDRMADAEPADLLARRRTRHSSATRLEAKAPATRGPD